MMIFIKRICKAGWDGFIRGVNLSLATCTILLLTSTLVGGLFLSQDIINFLVEEAKKKADVSVYLSRDCLTEEAFDLKEGLSSLSGVEEVNMKSREEALDEFVSRHSGDESLMESLSEVGYNPFLASLSIKAGRAEDFDNIASYLEKGEFENIIEKVDYHRRKPVIEKIFDLSHLVNRATFSLIVLFIIASVIITFTTIRLAIEARKKEISIMRLVGASNAFIQGPYLVQALIWGLISFVLSFGLLALASYLLTPRISVFFPGFRIFSFFKRSWSRILLAQFIASLGLSLIPSYLAVKKYLKV